MMTRDENGVGKFFGDLSSKMARAAERAERKLSEKPKGDKKRVGKGASKTKSDSITRQDPNKLAYRIYQWFKRQGDRGATMDEMLEALDMRSNYSPASARFSELKRARIIIPTGEKRFTAKGVMAEVFRFVEGSTYELYVERRRRFLLRGGLKKEADKLCQIAVDFKAAYAHDERRSEAVKNLIEQVLASADAISQHGVEEGWNANGITDDADTVSP